MKQRYLLTIGYDGTDFHGWQMQPDHRTVEEELEKAFSLLYQQEIDLIGQGRTDAGVHAENQTAHTDLPDSISEESVLRAMRGLLPEDIVLKHIEKREPDFHARFDALSRTYEYWILYRKDPLQRRVAWCPGRELNQELLQKCSEVVVGEHDFRLFCLAPDNPHQTTISTISVCEWDEMEQGCRFRIQGNRFLRQMVRRLVGTMVRVASGQETLDSFERVVLEQKEAVAVYTAPAHGLRLKKVNYN